MLVGLKISMAQDPIGAALDLSKHGAATAAHDGAEITFQLAEWRSANDARALSLDAPTRFYFFHTREEHGQMSAGNRLPGLSRFL